MPAIASSSSSSQRPHNLVSIFQAHFHVRRGNEITHQHGHEIDLSGVEWKALPSGSHALHRDLVWFHLPGQPEQTLGDEQRYHRVGVAAFVNRKLGGEDDEEQRGAEEDEDDDDQRGARMIAVGIIALAVGSTPSAHLAACLPHIDALESLASSSASLPRDHSIINTFLDAHRLDPSSSDDLRASLLEIEAIRGPAPLSRRAISSADPLLDLPAVANALGLLLPQLLRNLLVRGSRLVIFCPLGAQTKNAASIGWTIAEILEAALHLDEEEDGDAEGQEGGRNVTKLRHRRGHRVPQVRGIIGLQDLGLLQEEQERAPLSQGWISWTTDKLLLEKPDLYDCLLDLSPLFTGATQQHQAPVASSSSSSIFSSLHTLRDSSPNLYRVERRTDASAKKSKTTAKLKAVPWLPRDFALARSNEHRSVRLASKPRSLARRGSRSSVRPAASDDGGDRARLEAKPSAADQQVATASPRALLSHLLAFLRYWLSSLSFIPQQWRINLRESYGYVPLSIRQDGGVQAGLMLLPDSDSESDGGESESGSDDEGEQALEDAEGAPVGNSLASSSPQSSSARRSSKLSTANGGSSRRLRVPVGSTSNGLDSEPADDFFTNPQVSPREDDDDDIDPLLAACGVHSPAASRSGGGSTLRRSGSRSRQSSAAGTTTKDVLLGTDRGYDDEEASATTAISPSKRHLIPPSQSSKRDQHAITSSTAATRSRRHRRNAEQESHRDTRLARAIFTIWAEWLRELVLDLEALAFPSANDQGEGAADMPDDDDDDRAELLPGSHPSSSCDTTSLKSLREMPPLTSRQLSALGLNSRNEEDRLLVKDMTEGKREVMIGWRFWGNWL